MAAMVQVRLQSGTSRMTCWVDKRKDLREGRQITLRKSPDPEQRWTVLAIDGECDSANLHTDWHVGGL